LTDRNLFNRNHAEDPESIRFQLAFPEQVPSYAEGTAELGRETQQVVTVGVFKPETNAINIRPADEQYCTDQMLDIAQNVAQDTAALL
jgi:hypothetical protein